MRRALVTGASGYLGSAVVKALAARDVPAYTPDVDLRDRAALARAVSALDPLPDLFVHCAAVAEQRPLGEIDDAAWDETLAVNTTSAFVIARELVRRGAFPAGGDLVLCAALDGIQSVPSPAHFGASQGALLGLTHALAKELGPKNVRVNLCVIGVLAGGIAASLAPELQADYKKFAAYGRIGTADEAAKAILWVALEQSYMTGAVVPITGGL